VEASSGQPSKIVEPLIIPSRDELEAHLDKVFKEQLNADIEVTMSPATDGQYHQIEWDIADAYNYEPNADPTFPHQTFVHDGMLNVMGTESPMNMERPSPELWLIHRNLGALDNSTNIHVYLVAADRIVPLRVEANQVTTDAQNDMSLQGVTYRGDRMCFIASKRRSGTDSSGAGATIRGRTTGVIGHEVGHVFVGDGHPGDYSHYTDPSIIGVAPLPGTKHSDRLMYFGNVGSPLQSLDLEDRGKLLVKGEWDEAETWMNQFVDSPEQ
jgi:hypothetical protein